MDTTQFEQSMAQMQALQTKLDTMTQDMAYLVARQRQQSELIDEMMPIARAVGDTGIAKLGDLETRGYFTFGGEMLKIMDTVIASYSEEDVQQLGDNIVKILDTVKSVTQPGVLAIANEATQVLADADELEGVGLWGMMRKAADDDVKKGFAIAMEMLRHVGRAADKMSTDGKSGRKNRMNRRLAPTRRLDQPRRGASPAATRPAPTKKAPAKKARAATPADNGPSCPDPKAWTAELGLEIATSVGIEMTEAHWALIHYARTTFLETDASPNIRKMSTGSGTPTKTIYQLFPKAPGRTIARIAGIPKPGGCL